MVIMHPKLGIDIVEEFLTGQPEILFILALVCNKVTQLFCHRAVKNGVRPFAFRASKSSMPDENRKLDETGLHRKLVRLG